MSDLRYNEIGYAIASDAHTDTEGRGSWEKPPFKIGQAPLKFVRRDALGLTPRVAFSHRPLPEGGW